MVVATRFLILNDLREIYSCQYQITASAYSAAGEGSSVKHVVMVTSGDRIKRNVVTTIILLNPCSYEFSKKSMNIKLMREKVARKGKFKTFIWRAIILTALLLIS